VPLSLRDPIALTRHLVCTNTINPPGNEGELVDELALALNTLRLATLVQSIGPGRANLLAWNTTAVGSRLCFTGHLDTVPLGAAPWVQEPLVPALSNNLADPWIRQVTETVESVTGVKSQGRTVAFFTDGPVLRELFGDIPAIVIGPGEPSCAHQTDEWCSVERIHECVSIYSRLLEDWQS
jgi:acetylornithine deacetylase/succinyl-diaminopimelate desuccinylase-like protein